jgi:hypothetical protein
MFNAMAIELQGIIDGTRELLNEERRSLEKGIRRQEAQLSARRKQLAEIDADRLRMKPEREAKLRRMTHQNATSLVRLESKLRKVEARLVADVPGICFGTRRLFRQQHRLGLAGFDSRVSWLREWQKSRSHQVFFVGSKDETAGNQLCQLQRAGDGTYILKIRVPDRLLSPGDFNYLVVGDVTFDYDREALDAALEANVALSWRLHRDERGWRAFVSFNHQPSERTSLDIADGVVGIDFI